MLARQGAMALELWMGRTAPPAAEEAPSAYAAMLDAISCGRVPA
jgi:hypothetical protein